MITHLVLLKLTDPADVEEARRRLLSLVGVIPQIEAMEVHVDAVGAEGAHHMALLTRHADADGLRAYQQHPAHLEVAGWLRAHLEGRAFVDWDG